MYTLHSLVCRYYSIDMCYKGIQSWGELTGNRDCFVFVFFMFILV